jgi:GGDEF domain-containing protein
MLNTDLKIFELELKIIDLEKEIVKYKYDHLTGMKLRTDFEDELFDIFEGKNSFYMILIDVNDLHNINRDRGYYQGDMIIKKVSRIIKKFFGSMCWRIGGDEFIIIEENLNFKHRQFMREIIKYCSVSIVKKDAVKSGEQMVRLADEIMIKQKTLLYHNSIKDRRQNKLIQN